MAMLRLSTRIQERPTPELQKRCAHERACLASDSRSPFARTQPFSLQRKRLRGTRSATLVPELRALHYSLRAGWRIRLGCGSTALAACVAASACARSDEALRREHLSRGDKYVAQHKLDEAIIEFRIAAQIDPRSGEVRKKLGRAYLDINDNAHALGEFVRAADLLPDDLEVQLR